ncbi:FGGY-family carbohydrate kinase [Alicyclobacillus suci]|uniref:FGGY-family carbohydrate kinase n=1 Tax=Alicyclobacillus suci TaxID=2816080 RepID=UPI001A8F34F6|nr:FGGY-family carbohydrate kinase [Alicyclobacillus suci]
MKAVLGVDIGSASVRTAVYDLNGNSISYSSHPVELCYPKSGYVEASAEAYFEALKRSIKDACSNRNIRILALSVGATASTLVCSSEQGEIFAPVIMWMDNRAARESEIIRSRIGEFSSPEWLPAKALWVSRNMKSVWDKSRYVTELLDWINYKLTGEWVSSRCNVTCKRNYLCERSTRVFADIDGVNLFTKWPDKICSVGEQIGTLLPILAAELNLPATTLVVQGGIDAYMAMIGNGCIEEGTLSLTLGTSTVILATSKNPSLGDESIWGPFFEPVSTGRWVVEGGQVSSGSVLNWICSLSGKSHGQLIDEVERLEPLEEDVLMIENLQGNRTPYRNAEAKGAIFGLRLYHTAAHLYQGALHATALGAREAIEKVIEATKAEVKVIRASGGGVLNPLWLQAHADALNFAIEVPEEPEKIGLLGAAMVAAAGAGVFSSLPDAVRNLEASYHVVYPARNNSVLRRIHKIREKAYRSTEGISMELERVMRGANYERFNCS